MDVWTDIQTDPNCIVINNFVTKALISTVISGYPAGYGEFILSKNKLLFRLYDKEGLGYISTETLRGLIGELLAPLTGEVVIAWKDALEDIIDELLAPLSCKIKKSS